MKKLISGIILFSLLLIINTSCMEPEKEKAKQQLIQTLTSKFMNEATTEAESKKYAKAASKLEQLLRTMNKHNQLNIEFNEKIFDIKNIENQFNDYTKKALAQKEINTRITVLETISNFQTQKFIENFSDNTIKSVKEILTLKYENLDDLLDNEAIDRIKTISPNINSIAKILLHQRNFKDAEDILNKIMLLNKNNCEALLMMIDLLQFNDRHNEIRPFLDQFTSSSCSDDLKRQMIDLLGGHKNIKEFKTDIENILNSIINRDENDTNAVQGFINFMNQEYSKAITNFEKVNDKNYKTIIPALAIAYATTENYQKLKNLLESRKNQELGFTANYFLTLSKAIRDPKEALLILDEAKKRKPRPSNNQLEEDITKKEKELKNSCYKIGLDFLKNDPETAIEYFLAAGEKGHVDSLFELYKLEKITLPDAVQKTNEKKHLNAIINNYEKTKISEQKKIKQLEKQKELLKTKQLKETQKIETPLEEIKEIEAAQEAAQEIEKSTRNKKVPLSNRDTTTPSTLPKTAQDELKDINQKDYSNISFVETKLQPITYDKNYTNKIKDNTDFYHIYPLILDYFIYNHGNQDVTESTSKKQFWLRGMVTFQPLSQEITARGKTHLITFSIIVSNNKLITHRGAQITVRDVDPTEISIRTTDNQIEPILDVNPLLTINHVNSQQQLDAIINLYDKNTVFIATILPKIQ